MVNPRRTSYNESRKWVVSQDSEKDPAISDTTNLLELDADNVLMP